MRYTIARRRWFASTARRVWTSVIMLAVFCAWVFASAVLLLAAWRVATTSKARFATQSRYLAASKGIAPSDTSSCLSGKDRQARHKVPLSETEVLKAGVPCADAAQIAALSAIISTSGSRPLSDPLTLLRFYNARSRNVKAAADMYRETMDWRRTFGIKKLMADHGNGGDYKADGGRSGDPSVWTWSPKPSTPEAEFARHYAFFGRLKHVSQAGEPILLWRIGTVDYAGIVREELVDVMMRAWVVHLEDALQASRAASIRHQRLVRARLIIDAQDFSMSNVRYIPILKGIITLGKQYFPEVTASVTVVRAPSVAAQLYKLIKNLLTPLMVEKICILGMNFKEGLVSHAGLESAMALPIWLGGEAPDNEIVEPSMIPVGTGAALRGATATLSARRIFKPR